jgi:signal transduction histidine kinase
MLASARAVLAGVSLLATYLDPAEAGPFAPAAHAFLVGYSIFAAAILATVWRRPGLGVRYAPLLHAIDVVMAVALTIISEGLSSPFFPLFMFVLLNAAYRRGFRATVLTGLSIVGLLISEAILSAVLWPHLSEPIDLSPVMIRCTYLLVVAVIVGYLAEREKALRGEALLAARLSGAVRVERGLSASLQEVFQQLLGLVALSQARLFFHEDLTRRSFLWIARASSGPEPQPFRWRELHSAEAETYSFALPSALAVVQAVRHESGTVEVLAVDQSARRMPAFDQSALERLVSGRGYRTMICIPLVIADDSTARLFFADSVARPHSARDLAVLQRITQQVFPALYNVYLLRRLRSRAGELERARVARELHDGVIQSLMGLEMQLDVVRREAAALPPVAKKIGGIQGVLHGEVLNVRDLMHQMRPVDADARNLLKIISDLLERFRRDTGVQTQFVSEFQEVNLPPRTCRELARIVQEALVNIRRHSGASNVVVRLGIANGAWVLSIDDNGRGFDFEGRMSHDALESARKGPIVIKERVRTIGGTLAIESNPGSGSRLEVAIPQRAHA